MIFLLIYSTQHFSSLPLTSSSLILQTISHRFSLSDEAKQRTSQPNRPIVLRLCSVLLELAPSTDVPLDSELSPYLLAEEFHSDSSSVTIYCPIKGLHIVPISILFPYHISAILFKRHSQSHLVSPFLLRKFASFFPNLSRTLPLLLLSFPSLMVVVVFPMLFLQLLGNGRMPYLLLKWMPVLVLWSPRLKVGRLKVHSGPLTNKVHILSMRTTFGLLSRILVFSCDNFSLSFLPTPLSLLVPALHVRTLLLLDAVRAFLV